MLGGGLVGGSVTLLGGEPGIGKSTLLLQALAPHGRSRRALPARHAPRSRRSRCACAPSGSARSHPSVLVVAATSLPDVLAHVAEVESRRPRGRLDPDRRRSRGRGRARIGRARCASARTGSCAWPRTAALADAARRPRHEGGLARRARACSSTSSTPCSRSRATGITRCGMLHALKHRFGSTHELGLFEMEEAGLADVSDPSEPVPRRPPHRAPRIGRHRGARGRPAVLVEVQALVTPTRAPCPRRSAQGLDGNRLALLLAVLEARAGQRRRDADVYASVAGGDPGHRGRRRPRGRDRGGRRARRARRSPADLVAVGRDRARRRDPPGRPDPARGSPRRPGSGSAAPSCPRRSPTSPGSSSLRVGTVTRGAARGRAGRGEPATGPPSGSAELRSNASLALLS